ncbi:MAG: glycoside hydrolase family 3 protein [Bacteroidales bacterium]|nr:glycoside hydrolase family 3 protein [Bacteroidales bacterium]
MRVKNLLIGGVFLIAAQILMQACTGNQKPQSDKDKIETLIASITLEEKIGMTVGDGKFLPAVDPKTIEQGTGIIIANQNSKLVIPRLSVRTTALSDGPSGLNRDPCPEGATEYTYTTAFPTSTCLAATWNTGMLEKVGTAFGNEVLEYDYDLVLMPALNLHRNPKCGRNFEYYSEDPLLSGKLSASMVIGLQSNGVGIMTSYNKVNGYYTAELPELLQDIVRQEWGFEGLFITDFDGYGNAVAKVRAGNNMLMGGNMQLKQKSPRAVSQFRNGGVEPV